MKTRITFLALALLSAASLRAQVQDSILQAFTRSYALEKNQQYVAAATAFKPVYQDNHYEMTIRIGYMYYLGKRYDDAERYYNKAVQLRPNAIEAKLGLVYPLAAAEKWDLVVKQYIDIMRLAPTNTFVSYNLGVIYYNRKNYNDALKCFDMVHSFYPFDYSSLLMLGWTHLKLGHNKEARGFFEKAQMIAPEDKSVADGLALLK